MIPSVVGNFVNLIFIVINQLSKTENLDFNGVMNFISQFNKWACERISQVGGVEIGEVKSKIKELLGLEQC